MANAKFQNAAVRGIVTIVPPDVKCISDEVELYGGNEKQINRIRSTIGLDKRHVVDENTTSSDLCFQASVELMNGLGIERESIDGLVFVTQTPDYFQPCNAAVLHNKLGLSKDCASFDVNLGCSGYVYGLWLAHMMIQSRSCSRVLLLAGDTISKNVNKQDRSTAPLFGDAGSATLIEYDSSNTDSFFQLHTDGSGEDYIKITAGAFRCPSTEETRKEYMDDDGNCRSKEDLFMSGGDVFNFSIKTEPKAITDLLEFSGLTDNEIDYYVFHQANRYIINNIAKRLKLNPEKVPSETVGKYGNQSSASIPSTINSEINASATTDSIKVVLSGFGVGLSWASAAITIDRIYCPAIQIYNSGV